MKKIYSTHYSNLSFDIERGGVKVHVVFKNGCVYNGTRAKLITSDPLKQYFLENDPRFNSLYRLDKVIKEPSDLEKEKAAETNPKGKSGKEKSATIVESVIDLTGAIDYFASNEIICTDLKQVKAAMKKINVEFPNWK